MKTFATFTVMSIFAIIGWCVVTLGFLPNLGLKFGYWGEVNRSVAWLRARPNVRIDDVGCHTDLSIEAYWIRVMVDNRHQTLASFHEGSEYRDRLLRNATYIVFNCFTNPGQGCGGAYQCARIVDLRPGNIIEEKSGCDIRSVADVFDNFGTVNSVVDTLPFADEKSPEDQWKLKKNQTLYMSISCPSLGL